MKIGIYRAMRRLAYVIEINNVNKVFELLLNFLEKEPTDNFTTTTEGRMEESQEAEKSVELPLTFKSEESVMSFKEKTREQPNIAEIGLRKKPANMIYIIGQSLVSIANCFITFLTKNSDRKDIKNEMEKIYEIWGGFNKMNGIALADNYGNKTNQEAQTDLIKKLKESEILTKEIDNLLKKK